MNAGFSNLATLKAHLLTAELRALTDFNTQIGTNMVFEPNTTNTINAGTFTCTKDNDVGLKLAVTTKGTGTEVLTMTLQKSFDGTNWFDAAPIATLQLSQAANTTIVQVTNLTLGAIGYLRIGTVINAAANTNTAVVLTGFKKPVRQGN
jgi:hypothetical protein